MKLAKSMSVCALAAVLVAGCAGMTGPSDEEMIQSTVEQLKVALEEQDLDMLMETFSEDFEHPEVGGKEDARYMLEMGLDSGYAEGGEVSVEDMEIEFLDDGSASVYPIDLSSYAGSVAVELIMQKDDDAWLIRTLEVDGI